jgi:hypothetical protein
MSIVSREATSLLALERIAYRGLSGPLDIPVPIAKIFPLTVRDSGGAKNW